MMTATQPILVRCLIAATLLSGLWVWSGNANAQSATVTATVVADFPDSEARFEVEMEAQRVELSHGGTATDRAAPDDLYRMALLPAPGYRLADIICLGDHGGRLSAFVDFDSQTVSIEPGADSFVNCVFRLQALVATVRSRVITDQPSLVNRFVVEMQGESVDLEQGEVATDHRAPSGRYHIALLPAPQFRLMDIICLDDDDQRLDVDFLPENQSVSLSPGIGAIVDCTFRLQSRTSTVSARVLTDAREVTEEFVVEMGAEEVHLREGMTAIDSAAQAGTYHLALLQVPGFRLLDIACLDEEAVRQSATILAENQSVGLTLSPGEHVDCTFRLGAQFSTVTATVVADSAAAGREFVVDLGGEQYSLLHGQTATDRRASASLYRLSLEPGPGFRLLDVACLAGDDDNRMSANLSFEDQSIEIGPGSRRHINCIFKVELRPGEDITAADGPVAGAPAAATGDCCSCRVAATMPIPNDDLLPCTFDMPAGWRAGTGIDGGAVSLVAGADCGAQCPVSPGIAFHVNGMPDRYAETMEESWALVMNVVGRASCGGEAVTFFETPGSDANGLIGGLRFHIGFGGARYGGAASFTCAAPGEWRLLRDQFIRSFRTNDGTGFGNH